VTGWHDLLASQVLRNDPADVRDGRHNAAKKRLADHCSAFDE